MRALVFKDKGQKSQKRNNAHLSRFWFHFTVENTQRDQRVIFNVVNLSKARSLFSQGLTPVVKSTSRPRFVSHS